MRLRRRFRAFLIRVLPPHLTRDARGLTVLEIIVALSILVIALVAIYGLVSNAVTSFGVSEDFLDVQQNARLALERFSEEARWATVLTDPATFDGRPPFTPGPPCPGNLPLCANRVYFVVPRGNPIIPDCTYMVRYQMVGGSGRFSRLVKPDPDTAKNPNFGVGACTSTSNDPLAEYVTVLTFNYCNGANPPVCTPPYNAITQDQVVRIRVDMTLSKTTGGGVAYQRTIGSDMQLRNIGQVAPPVGATPTPTSPWRPTPGKQFQTQTPTPTETATATVTATATRTATVTATRTATRTATATVSATRTATVTLTGATATRTATRTPTVTLSGATASATSTTTRTGTPTPTRTRTATSTGPTATATRTATRTATVTPTATVSATRTATVTATRTATVTATRTATPTVTPTRTITPTPTPEPR